jgi:hypothetical protein
MSWYREPEYRLTHKPTGISVRVLMSSRYRPGDLGRAHGTAYRWLKSRLCAPIEMPNPVRTYTFAPARAAGIRQGDVVLVQGADRVQAVLDGRLDLLRGEGPHG